MKETKSTEEKKAVEVIDEVMSVEKNEVNTNVTDEINESVKESTTDVVEETKDTAETQVEKVTETIEETTTEIADVVEETTTEVTDVVEETKEPVETKVEEVTETVEEATTEVADVVEETKVEEVTESVEETTTEVTDVVEETKDIAETQVEKVTETVEETTTEVTDVVEETKEPVETKVDEVKESIEETGSKTTVSEVVESLKTTVSNEEVTSEEAVVEKIKIDFTLLDKKELLVALENILDTEPIQDIKADVDAIKASFYKQNKVDIEENKKAFIENGGEPEAFVIEIDEDEEKLKQLIGKYKSAKAEYNKNIELEKEANVKKKLEIIENINNLINGKESINRTFEEFHTLQKQWNEVGVVPQANVKNLWETYHHTVEKFYDFIKINRELRDLDFRRNLESKLNLCDRADELLIEPSVVKAFNSLQKLHEQWREIGPVPNEKREELWERFKDTTSKINKAHQSYFDKLKESQVNNLKAKIVLCEKAEEISALEPQKHKEWDDRTTEIVDLQKLWRAIGFATKRENNSIFERFRVACDKFFTKKRDFYKVYKDEQTQNMQMKTQLCMAAEAIKDSTDWKATTDELIGLQKQWKEIGPVHRKQSDAIWKRFRAACNDFFESKENHFANIDQEYNDNLTKKKELIEKVKTINSDNDANDALKSLNEIQREWTLIGFVPFKHKDKVQKEFRAAVDAQFDNLNIDKVKRSVFAFKQKINNLSEGKRGERKIQYEKDKIRETIKQLESDINLLDNNIGFFAKTKGAESLIRDVHKKIEDTKESIKIEKQKLNMLNKQS